MKRARTTADIYYNGSLCYRAGLSTARKVLGGEPMLCDYNDYGPAIEWEGPNGWCWTDYKGHVTKFEPMD